MPAFQWHMDTKPIFSVATMFLVLCLFLGCVPKACQEFEDRAWAFELPVTLTPSKDTFQVGDTIVIESRFSNQVRDSVSGEVILLDDYDFFPRIWMSKNDRYVILGNQYENPISLNEIVSTNFDYQVVNHSDGSATMGVDSYNYDGAFYDYRLQMRLDSPGSYFFVFVSFLDLLPDWTPNENPEIDHECSNYRGDIKAYYRMNGGNVIENNIEIFRSSNAPDAQIRKTGNYRDFGCYAFIIVE